MPTEFASPMLNDETLGVSREPVSIAIVGGGPRGLYVLESLARTLRRSDRSSSRPVHVTIFETATNVGAGNTYGDLNPPELRMNFANGLIDAFVGDAELANSGDARLGPTLVQWMAERSVMPPDNLSVPRGIPSVPLGVADSIDRGPDGYVDRRTVGQYLHDAFLRVVNAFPDWCSVRSVRRRVDHVTPCDDTPTCRWQIHCGSLRRTFDCVSITVGHEGWRPPTASPVTRSLETHERKSTPTINGIYPTPHRLNRTAVQPGSRVLLRGFGLTFIDAALSLTEGRGGSFVFEGATGRYVRGGDEPETMTVQSRSMRPMLAKPDHRFTNGFQNLDDHWSLWRQRMRAVSTGTPGSYATARAIVFKAADAALDLVSTRNPERVERDTAPNSLRAFETFATTPMRGRRAVELMRQSVDAATGGAMPSELAMVGEAWRKLYQPLTEILQRDGIEHADWLQFQSDAPEMERLAFGPPAENLARIVALFDAGLLEMSSGGSVVATDYDATDYDVLIDARIASPHHHRPGGLLERMIDDGTLRLDTMRRGIRVDDAGRPIGDDGETTRSMGVFGRCTEGVIIGNDTLSRAANRSIERWVAQWFEPSAVPKPRLTQVSTV